MSVLPSALAKASLFRDPSTEADFDPTLLPRTTEAHKLPKGRTDRFAEAKSCYRTIYYRLNDIYRGLRSLKEGSSPRRRLLEKLVAAQDLRDALEDATAPYGLFAEPIVARDGLTARCLRFTAPPSRYEVPASSSFSLYARIDDSGARDQSPGRVRRVSIDELERLLRE